MEYVLSLLAQLAGIAAFILLFGAVYSLYQTLAARKQARSALFNAERQSASDRAIRSLLTMVLLFGVALVLFGLALIGEGSVPSAAPPTPTIPPTNTRSAPVNVMPSITPVTPQPSPAIQATPVAPTNTPQPATPGTPRKTGVVSGVGENLLKLRREPTTAADIVAQYPDGTVLEVLEGQQTNQGIVWQHVRDAQGNEGWVANQYLVYTP